MQDAESEGGPGVQDLLRALTRRDALAPVAVLTRVLVHEVGNRLNPIGLQIELLRRRCAQDARALEVLDALRDSLRQLDGLLRRSRALAQELAPATEQGEELARVSAALIDFLHGDEA